MNDNNYELDSYQMLKKEISKYPSLNKEDNIVLCTEYIKKCDNSIRQRIINGNLRLVLKVAHKYSYKYPNIDILDLFQEGTFGLMKAVDNYNPNLGSFSNYALPWISQAVARYVKTKNGNIRIPINLQEKIQKYKNICYDYKQMNQSLPDDKTIAKILNVTLETLMEIKKIDCYNTQSLNQPLNDDSENEVIDFIPSYKNETDELLNEMENKVLFIVLKNVLSPLEYFIIYHRILSSNRMTLEEVSDCFCLTRERVRQVEDKALTKLRKYMSNDKKQLYEAYKIISKDIISLEHYRIEPYNLNDIIDFLLVKPLLSTKQIALLYELRFGNYNFTIEKQSQVMGVSYSEFLETNKSIEEKLNDFITSNPDYENNKRDYLKTFGICIFEQLENHEMYIANYFSIKEKYDCLSYEEIVKIFDELGYELSQQELKLLDKYFKKENEMIETEFSYEEIKNFYLSNKDNMPIELQNIYVAYLNDDLHIIDDRSSKIILKTNESDKIDLNIMSKDSIISILKKYGKSLEKNIYLYLMNIMAISKQDFMTAKELNELFGLLNNLEKIRSFNQNPSRKLLNDPSNS